MAAAISMECTTSANSIVTRLYSAHFCESSVGEPLETKVRLGSVRGPECISAIDPRSARFVDDVCSLHDVLRFKRLVAAIEDSSADYYVARRYGIVTLAARTCDIPRRYLLGVLGFRLAEYLRVGYA